MNKKYLLYIILLLIVFFNWVLLAISIEHKNRKKQDDVKSTSIEKTISDYHDRMSRSNYFINYQDFFKMFDEWKKSDPQKTIPGIKTSSFPNQYIDYDQHMQRIRSLKVAALPYLHEIIQGIEGKPNYYQDCCLYLFHRITKVQINYDYRNMMTYDDFGIVHKVANWKKNVLDLSNWWLHGYPRDINQFKELYSSYKATKNYDMREAILENMKKIGVRILPNIIKKVIKGDWQLLEVADYYTENELAQDRKKADFKSLSMQDKQKWIKKWWEEHKDLYSLDYKSLYEA